MFKVIKPDSLSWPVDVDVPVDDGAGGSEKQTFTMRFKYLDVPELNQALAKITVSPSANTVRDYVIGWDGIANEDGTLVYSPENLDALLLIPFMTIAINRAFMECQTGRERKN